jgi:hypothetical protein
MAAEACELCGRALELTDQRDDTPRLCADCLEQVMLATLLEEM